MMVYAFREMISPTGLANIQLFVILDSLHWYLHV